MDDQDLTPLVAVSLSALACFYLVGLCVVPDSWPLTLATLTVLAVIMGLLLLLPGLTPSRGARIRMAGSMLRTALMVIVRVSVGALLWVVWRCGIADAFVSMVRLASEYRGAPHHAVLDVAALYHRADSWSRLTLATLQAVYAPGVSWGNEWVDHTIPVRIGGQAYRAVVAPSSPVAQAASILYWHSTATRMPPTGAGFREILEMCRIADDTEVIFNLWLSPPGPSSEKRASDIEFVIMMNRALTTATIHVTKGAGPGLKNVGAVTHPLRLDSLDLDSLLAAFSALI